MTNILDLEMRQPNDAGAATIREYLTKLLTTLWEEDEGFSGKRPFGNSGWQYDLYEVLMRHGKIRGKFDEDGYIDECDDTTGYNLILDAIEEMCRGSV